MVTPASSSRVRRLRRSEASRSSSRSRNSPGTWRKSGKFQSLDLGFGGGRGDGDITGATSEQELVPQPRPWLTLGVGAQLINAG
ncbi:hypothetical protein DV515_00016237 [Chloebia gouldiae]|uniref:Uncharacterized protein n=1 Tax=Chloebia gouldiae TaxID=44316 RepID=A0A3L8RT90_CHLGU|nr:hypothetical protein DV515_00016237 [Chloebia gouldiae]